MHDTDSWSKVLYFSKKITDLNAQVSHITQIISEIAQSSEDAFGEYSNEMDTIIECILDFRHSRLEDLLQFVDFLSERQKADLLPHTQ